MKCINRIERYSDIVEAATKNTDGDILTEEELGPPLPPRPPPRVRNVPANNNGKLNFPFTQKHEIIILHMHACNPNNIIKRIMRH